MSSMTEQGRRLRGRFDDDEYHSYQCCLVGSGGYLCNQHDATFDTYLRETDVKDVGFGGGANAQMKLLRVVFLKRDLDEAFAVRHAILLAFARWTGSVGFLLVMFVMVANLLGHRV